MGKGREIELTERDREVLSALARCVRVFSLRQIAGRWWDSAENPERACRARLKNLESAGYLEIDENLVHPQLQLAAPVVEWCPSLPAPDFRVVSSALRARWTETLTPTLTVTIANAAAPEFGGHPAPALRTDEITHDLHLAAVYLTYTRRWPDLARNWVGERVIRRTRTASGPLPDAMIRGQSLTRIIEFGGAYTTDRVGVFHAFCEAQALPYEIW